MKYVLYHKGCNDGFGAAYAFWLKHPEYKYIACNSNMDPPVMKDAEHVYMVDFSYPRNFLLEMQKAYPITVLDHHESNEKDLQGLEFAKFSRTKSGCVMAWEFVHGEMPVPKMLQYIQDRDLYTKTLPWSDEVFYYMLQHERTFINFRTIQVELDAEFNLCVSMGNSIKRYVNQTSNVLAAKARKGKLCGQDVLFVNTSILQSEVGDKLFAERKENFVACYSDTSEGGIYVSLRSRKGHDCTPIAAKFGGGGHKGASGFYIPASCSVAFINANQKR